MKRGFTLIELLAVVVILAVIAVITTVAVDKTIKDNKESLYQGQLASIADAARTWGVKHIKEIPDNEGEAISVPLKYLKDEGLLPADLKNSKTDKLYPNDLYVDISYERGSYIYKVSEKSINEATDNSNVQILNHKYGE